ncbi:hypothetical protein FWD07_00570 [Candidatus Saccharibacteria bacterium]|nr:hypothetical protein [Candidatus Saccharibacteria bacterium]
MTIVKGSAENARTDNWSVQNGEFVEGDDIQTTSHLFVDQNETIVHVHVKGEHGWVTASSDYRYYIVSGELVFEFEIADEVECVSGESLLIPAGVRYNYRPKFPEHPAETILFMSSLWVEA